MKTPLSSLVLPFAFAAFNANAFNDPVIESLPAAICLVDVKGQAALYRQYGEEGLFVPHVKSTQPVKAIPTGFKAIFSAITPMAQPTLSKGASGQYQSSAIEFDAKSRTWLKGSSATLDVHITSWHGDEPSGKCVGAGKFPTTAYIVSGKNYEPIEPGNPIYRHIGLDKNNIPSSLLSAQGPKHN